MRCNACGNEIPNGSTMCPFCGSAIKNENDVEKTQTTGVEVEKINIQNNLQQNPVENQESSSIENNIDVERNVLEQTDVSGKEASYIMDATGEHTVVSTGSDLVTPTIEPNKKKSKKGLIIGIIVALIIVIVAILGVFGYMFLYKSADKRISNIIDNAFKQVSSVSNDEKKASGTLSMDGHVSVGSTTYSAKLSAKYGVDLTKKIMNFDASIESLNIGMELLDETLKVNTYLKDSNVYLYFSNFYDKYVYTKVDGLDEIFNSTTTTDVDSKVLIDGFKDAIKAGLLAADKTQKMKANSNVVTIKLNKENQTKISNAAKKSILGNEKFLTELSKISGKDKSELKSSLEKETITEQVEDAEGYIELLTNVFGNEFECMNIVTNVFEMNITNENIAFKVMEGGKEQANGKIKFTSKAGAKTNEVTANISLTAYVSEKAYTVELNIKNESDVNPSVESADLKDAVEISSLSQEDILNIYNKVSKFGKLGSILSNYITSTITQPTTDITE